MDLVAYSLIGAACAFAFSMGAHYTGACMGMPYASGAIRPVPALLLMAPLTFLGAFLASSRVESTVGSGLLPAGTVSVALALGIVLSAFALTSLFNVLRIPTSTIQILVFSVVGAGWEAKIPVEWGTVTRLLLLWAIAPFAAFAVAYLVIRFADRHEGAREAPSRLTRPLVITLVGIGTVASFAMGANDVANATGSFVMTGLFGPMTAGLLGGLGLALGVIAWGKPLLERVAFDVVKLDARMASAAQFSQSIVILSYVAFGYFTSMNQSLVGAMIGTGYARGQTKIQWRTVRGILLGWAVGPLSGAALGYLLVGVLTRVVAG